MATTIRIQRYIGIVEAAQFNLGNKESNLPVWVPVSGPRVLLGLMM